MEQTETEVDGGPVANGEGATAPTDDTTDTATRSGGTADGTRSPLAVAVPVFAVVAAFAAVAYTLLASVVDLVTVELLAYPVATTAPFVVITGAILTIPVLAVTTLVTTRRLER